mgnify:CR=1 FL=1
MLDKICSYKKAEVASRKASVPLSVLEERIKELRPARDFRQALRTEGMSLISEIKRRSPSKGALTDAVDPVELGKLYESAGAQAISVLTDQEFFGGTLDDLRAVRHAVSIPCLRKDFVIDEYQLYEARANSADAALLIVRILSDEQIRDYLDVAESLGMACLVETHSAEEIERALKAEAHIIGINNRDLDTFEVNLDTTLTLKKRVPGGVVLVSESGIHTREDVKVLEDGGIDAILVGEALMTSSDVRAKIRHLLGL